ncbi:hypothetical protein FEM48_Zijuj06G0171700 [Ziziphus jujuba var. spinosa]|uniref:Pentatricopeptide repeat-containing protein n=1 Tax=Ziziphus jujuba var. spinosa TaxID=714518 RepID=A0A978VAJ7_ZIZJJ|nr:hypothetical protein FEM48_Zijuj06G0171700 [Ziziphus jujuba var. spinosa]
MPYKSFITWNFMISLLGCHSSSRRGLLCLNRLWWVTCMDFEEVTAWDVVSWNTDCKKTGQYNETLKLLCRLEEPESVSWNIVIAACARNNYRIKEPHHMDCYNLALGHNGHAYEALE